MNENKKPQTHINFKTLKNLSKLGERFTHEVLNHPFMKKPSLLDEEYNLLRAKIEEIKKQILSFMEENKFRQTDISWVETLGSFSVIGADKTHKGLIRSLSHEWGNRVIDVIERVENPEVNYRARHELSLNIPGVVLGTTGNVVDFLEPEIIIEQNINQNTGQPKPPLLPAQEFISEQPKRLNETQLDLLKNIIKWLNDNPQKEREVKIVAKALNKTERSLSTALIPIYGVILPELRGKKNKKFKPLCDKLLNECHLYSH